MGGESWADRKWLVTDLELVGHESDMFHVQKGQLLLPVIAVLRENVGLTWAEFAIFQEKLGI